MRDKKHYFTLLFSWLLALDGFDFPILFPVSFFFFRMRGRSCCVLRFICKYELGLID